MPLIEKSAYKGPPFYQFNKHLQTILPAFRNVQGVHYKRERINTPDGDFLDLDWIDNKNGRLIVLTHGLEGNSHRPYIMGMSKIFSEHGWDVLAWHCRSCSGQMNRNFQLYNHGDVEDISVVVNHAFAKHKYKEIVLAGFSMGGNISLKYAALRAHPSVSKVMAFSAPLDMRTSTAVLDDPSNRIYQKIFRSRLLPKIEMKAQLFPDRLDIEEIRRRTDWNFQCETFFCTVNGYKSLDDFYEQGSAVNFISQIKIPTLIVQAQNDPMLTKECLPVKLAKEHPKIYLETPQYGGHCGFTMKENRALAYSEVRSLAFAEVM